MEVLLVATVCMKKWKNLVDQFWCKYDKSGSGGVPISEKVQMWRFYDKMSFLKEFIVNRK